MATTEEIRSFWQETRAALDRVEIDAEVEAVDLTDPLLLEGPNKTRLTYRVTMCSLDRRRIRGWSERSGRRTRRRELRRR